MKLFKHLICVLFILLLCGENSSYAHKCQVLMNLSFEKSSNIGQQLNSKNSSYQRFFSEIADFDLEEECHTSNEHDNDNSANIFLDSNQSLYLISSRQLLYTNYSKNNKIATPRSANSIPIYLRIESLRI
jgi:hypothetical protein